MGHSLSQCDMSWIIQARPERGGKEAAPGCGVLQGRGVANTLLSRARRNRPGDGAMR